MVDDKHFGDTFCRLTGHQPFSWQRRLFREWFALGRVPPDCDIPTGLGKTAVMAVWLIAKAWGAPLPRRLVYVVDRRAVVDQATQFAEQLRENTANALGIENLPISTLRGRFVDNRRWLEDPSASAIIVGTIDMIGSRLLFEGYGVSRRMRPYQAGMLGADTLLVLDEAHLCPPFEALLRAIATNESLKPEGGTRCNMVPKFHVLPLSATGRGRSQNSFRLAHADNPDPKGSGKYYVYICTSHVLNTRTYDLDYALCEATPVGIMSAWDDMNQRFRHEGRPYEVKGNDGKGWCETCRFCYYKNNNRLLHTVAQPLPDRSFA